MYTSAVCTTSYTDFCSRATPSPSELSGTIAVLATRESYVRRDERLSLSPQP